MVYLSDELNEKILSYKSKWYKFRPKDVNDLDSWNKLYTYIWKEAEDDAELDQNRYDSCVNYNLEFYYTVLLFRVSSKIITFIEKSLLCDPVLINCNFTIGDYIEIKKANKYFENKKNYFLHDFIYHDDIRELLTD